MLRQIKLKIISRLQARLLRMAQSRPPDFKVGERYLKRWYVLIKRNPFFNVYYHEFGCSDDPRFLHDHFYINCSIIIEGPYIEHTVKGPIIRNTGDIVFRLPKTLHRIEIPEGKIIRSVFITGPRVRVWGFQTDKGWLPHEEYLAKYGTNPFI